MCYLCPRLGIRSANIFSYFHFGSTPSAHRSRFWLARRTDPWLVRRTDPCLGWSIALRVSTGQAHALDNATQVHSSCVPPKWHAAFKRVDRTSGTAAAKTHPRRYLTCNQSLSMLITRTFMKSTCKHCSMALQESSKCSLGRVSGSFVTLFLSLKRTNRACY